MQSRVSLVSLSAAALAASALCGSIACSSRQPNLAPPPRPPDPAQLSLAPIRVTRAAWTNAAQSTLATVTAPPTGRRGRMSGPPMTADLAQPVLVQANEAVRACYRGLLALSPQSGGSIVALMRVAPDGTVSDVEPVGNTDPSLLIIMPCVLNAVRTRRFPATRGSTLLSFPFLLHSGEVGGANANSTIDMPRPRPGELQVPNPEPITVRPWRPTLVPNTNPVRELTRDMAAEAAADITSLVDTCYSAALVMLPDMSGHFNLRVAVEPSGNVSRVEVQDQNSLAGPLRECVIVLGRRLQFHSSGGGAVVSVDVSLAQSEGAAPGGLPTPGAPMGSMPSPGPLVGAPAPVGGSSGGFMPMAGSPR